MITLENEGKHKIQLPQRFDDFLKKMRVEQNIQGEEYIYVNDKNEKYYVKNITTYEKMKELSANQKNARLLIPSNQPLNPILKREMSSSVDEEDDRGIEDTNYIAIFFSDNDRIPCQCSFSDLKIGNNQCSYCNDTKELPLNSFNFELQKAFRKFFKENFGILKEYIYEKYNLKIKSFSDWLVFHKQLMNFDITEEFTFQCIQCHHFCSKQITVYIKQQQYPQSPVCVDCYSKMNQIYKKNYEQLVSIKGQPNISQHQIDFEVPVLKQSKN